MDLDKTWQRDGKWEKGERIKYVNDKSDNFNKCD